MEPTSEQELKELLDEGKISQEEYQQLLEALHRKQVIQPQPPFQQPEQSKQAEKYGKAALILMIIGLLLFLAPILFNIISAISSSASAKRGVLAMGLCPFLFLGMLCEVLAFIFGIIGWKSPAGKFAALGVPCLGLLAVATLPVLFLAARATNVPAPKEASSEIRAMKLLKSYPLDSLEGVITPDAVLDEQTSADGHGSLRFQTQSPDKTVFRLFETGPIEIQDKMLFYSAKLKSQLQQGKAYLEMWCDIPDKGDFFSRSLENPVTGSTNWTTVQTPFRLETGQMPANVKLNLIIEGLGTVWIDDIKLMSSSLN